MKFKLFFLIFALCNTVIISTEIKKYDPLLVIVIMVKNEQEVIKKTLQPFVDAGIDSFFVFDTGSMDDTVKVTENFFAKNKIISGCIAQEPFVDFATSRNRALELAETQFPKAAFILMPDAEWYLQQGEKLVEFCKNCLKHGDESQSYLIRLVSTNLDFYAPRLIRCKKSARFVGVVHEVLAKATTKKVPADIYFDLKVSKKGLQKSAQRWVRDRDLLLKEYYKNILNPRTVFYLAQTYGCLGDWENACRYYRLRTDLQGWSEENFMAQYRFAQAIEHCIPHDPTYTWSDALDCYLHAYQMRPQRAEPLIRVAQHYWNSQEYDLCFLFANRACEIPYPKQDMLFIEKDLYDLVRYDLLGRCAWYIAKYKRGEWAVKKALQVRPDMIHLHTNLAFYIKRKKEEFLSKSVPA